MKTWKYRKNKNKYWMERCDEYEKKYNNERKKIGAQENNQILGRT